MNQPHGSVHEGFLADNRFVSEFFEPLQAVSFHRGCPYSYIRRMKNRAVRGHRSEAQSHPTDMNNSSIHEFDIL
jgi:hypothetical protein